MTLVIRTTESFMPLADFYERLLMLAVEEWGNTETQTDRVLHSRRGDTGS